MNKILIVALAFFMPATLQLLPLRGKGGETCFVLIDANNVVHAVRCSRQAWEA